MQSTEVAGRFEQVQTEWRQKTAHTGVQKTEKTAQMLGRTEAQKLERTAVVEHIAVVEAGGSVVAAAAVGFRY